MSSLTAALRWPSRTLWTLLAVSAVALIGASVPSTAHAGRIAAERAEARQVEARLNALNARVDAAVQAYDEAVARRDKVTAAIRVNTARLRLARHNLHVSESELAQVVVSGYKSSGQSAAEYVLASGSFSDLITRVDVVRRTDALQAQVVHQVQVDKRVVETRQAKLKRERRAAVKLVAHAREERARVQAMVAHENAVLASVKGKIAQLIKQQQARRAEIARERAAAARRQAAEQAAAPPPPSPGSGSTGGGGAGFPAPPPAGSVGEQAVAIAERELGVPYVWGGASPAGFDCSGLTMWVYAQLGIHLDHFTGSQWNAGPHVPRADLEPGDLVFFEPDIGHVGIYIGNNLFIHAPHTGTVVQISSLTGWYAAEYQGAVRVA
ncbi:MAG TPA: NlpC/P60 family protein [Gaiellales bacterium]|nr:NlpC/P60 family protein [Gaiellales bacterium]